MFKLKNPYISVGYDDGPSFGGSQRRSGNRTIEYCGCGVVAATDLLLYITKYQGLFADSSIKSLSLYDIVPDKKYDSCLKKMALSYFPLIPRLGMNGLGLMLGMQLYFARHSMPYSCHWCISDKGIWDKVSSMLMADIPVIMSVGPNFPLIWKNGKAVLYTKNDAGEYKAASGVKAHFITITGIDDNWLEISSWGHRYYLNRRMYEEYVSMYSASLVSNILYVKHK
ncbi:MAG: hypothetical protein IJ364_08810 [Oscillospiraceae bacterium]|nr:hypothetical protein [Oscillospiraceae bacterium]